MIDPSNPIVNLGELSKPATVLVERVSDAIGGIFKPYQIHRVAEAEAKAKKIQVVSDLKLDKLKDRAFKRFLNEEVIKQNNIENIVRKAILNLKGNAKPQDIELDWIINFFDKSKLISDEGMQDLWARILAGEGNVPGSFSKRTINLMSSLDKRDALLFEKICDCIWDVGGPVPLIYEDENEVYRKKGINFAVLKHLDSIGLISYEGLAGYNRTKLDKHVRVSYQKKSILIELQKEKNNVLPVGKVLLTTVGKELSTTCNIKRVNGLFEYVLEHWKKQGVKEYTTGQLISN